MDHNTIASQSQAHINVQSKIDEFFGRFKIATLMHQCGVRKHHGHSVRSLTKAIFTLPFIGKNFFRGIVINSELPFGKDAAYDLLKGETYNWRRLLLALAPLPRWTWTRMRWPSISATCRCKASWSLNPQV